VATGMFSTPLPIIQKQEALDGLTEVIHMLRCTTVTHCILSLSQLLMGRPKEHALNRQNLVCSLGPYRGRGNK
jgi:hypothetical protein